MSGLIFGLLVSGIVSDPSLSMTAIVPAAAQTLAPQAAASDLQTPASESGSIGPNSAPLGSSDNSVVGDATSSSVVEARLESAPLSDFDARRRDEIWIISSRNVRSRNSPLHSLQFRRQIDGGHWQTETADRFFAESVGTVPISNTVIFVHGNRTSEQKAIRRGLQTYDRSFKDAYQLPAVRFVIWLWPADQIPGQLRDVRAKATRADEHSFHLARVIDRMPVDEFVSVIGYSFGGRLAIGSMHLLGGGALCGSRLPLSSDQPNLINLTLVVPAIRNDCFVTSRNAALKKVNHLFVLYNSRDQYLKLYRFLKIDDFRPALGYTGVCGLPGSQFRSDRINQFNASRQIGPDHDYLGYLVDERVERQVQQNLFSDRSMGPQVLLP